jgi:hypothetical protein
MTSGDSGVDCLLVVRSVRNERRDGTIDLIEQCADLRRIIYVGAMARPRNPTHTRVLLRESNVRPFRGSSYPQPTWDRPRAVTVLVFVHYERQG